MISLHRLGCATLAVFFVALLCEAGRKNYLPGIEWQEPPVVTPGAEDHLPPSDAVVLFDGSETSAWKNIEKWRVEDGELVVDQKGHLFTKQHFGDCQLHIEWAAPAEIEGEGQGRGNSGVYFCAFKEQGVHGYEVQILDSYQNETYFEGQAASIYKQTPPMANAMRPPGEWNTYDILFTAPRFREDGTLKSPAYVTVIQNGVVVQNHYELLGDTPSHRPPRYSEHPLKGPIMLQYHQDPVRFRNIWVRELQPAEGKRVAEPMMMIDGKLQPLSAAKG